MLGVNAKQLTKLLKAQNETTKQSNQIANQLIKDLEVRKSYYATNQILVLFGDDFAFSSAE